MISRVLVSLSVIISFVLKMLQSDQRTKVNGNSGFYSQKCLISIIFLGNFISNLNKNFFTSTDFRGTELPL